MAAPGLVVWGVNGFQSKLPDVLTHCYSLIRRDLDRADRALQAFDPMRDWHIHNFGEWWMVWLEIHSAHSSHEAKIVTPALPAGSVNAEAVKNLEVERKEIAEFVGRVTFHLLNLRDAPREAPLRTAILLKMREVFIQFSSRVREHILSAEKTLLPGWKALDANTRARVAASIAKDTSDLSQWWLPWYSNEFSDDAYLEFLAGLPTCCASGTQLNFHRYFRPQWRSRIDPLLPSIYDRSVKSPTEKEAPHFLWCCYGYDSEDPQSEGFCVSVPRIRPVYTAPKAQPLAAQAAPAAPKPAAPAPAAAPVQAPKPVAAVPVIVPAGAPAGGVGAPASVSVAANAKPAAAPVAAPAPVAAAAPAPAAAKPAVAAPAPAPAPAPAAATAAAPAATAAAAPAAPTSGAAVTSDPTPVKKDEPAAAPAPATAPAAPAPAAAAAAKKEEPKKEASKKDVKKAGGAADGEAELKKVEAKK